MARTRNIAVLNLVPTTPRSDRPAPGAYLVQVDANGATDIQRLPDGALLMDGGAWERFWAAMQALSPHAARNG